MKPMKHASDEERWISLVAARGRGQSLTPEEAEFLRHQEEAEPELADEAALWAEIGRLGSPRGEGAELDDGVMASRVLAKLQEERAPSSAEPFPEPRPRPLTRPMTRRGVAGLAATLAFAAALGAFAATWMNTHFGGPERPIEGIDAGPPPPAQTTAPPKPVEVVAPMPSSVEAPAASVAEAPAASVVEAPVPAAPPRAADQDGRRGKVSAGSSADELLGEAQAALAAGRTRDAITTYQTLLARYPESTEARAALVSLGRLSLAGGNAGSALGFFDRYLASGGGALAIEARYGRIQALQQLGRAGEAQAAIDDFLARHGDSVFATRLREQRKGH
ncbi:tetratricopeptide repeat protein [Polyangium mundeleinium]|uniref:Tetratricopeptide repeat protein n=1 Tax=Polyangium mundeleinium TaxID=2995306 RepID=A0ABT5EU72_9BACT|nr:tetratricopeptide repeat protein [Polyangium mundeleinium]MDC0745326.1 tetratricopeptide repeat protein [Polyangium mundeleinium]